MPRGAPRRRNNNNTSYSANFLDKINTLTLDFISNDYIRATDDGGISYNDRPIRNYLIEMIILHINNCVEQGRNQTSKEKLLEMKTNIINMIIKDRDNLKLVGENENNILTISAVGLSRLKTHHQSRNYDKIQSLVGIDMSLPKNKHPKIYCSAFEDVLFHELLHHCGYSGSPDV